MIAAALLALGLAAAPLQDPVGTVRGTVRSAGSDAPLAGATVELPGTAGRATFTDSAGSYVLRAVPAGRRVLRAWRLDHEPFEVEVEVPARGEVVLDLSLRPRTLALAEVKVRARASPGAPEAPEPGEKADTLLVPSAALQLTGMKGLEITPGIAELGVGEQPRGGTGQAPADPADVLYVRGSSAELKLVLLDGAPVYTPFHLGGLLDPFEANALGAARLYLGGAPARYDGGLSYILDLSTRPGRGGRIRSTGSLDLISARATAEGPATERARYLVAGRALHPWGMAPLAGEPLPYSYRDGLARVDVRVGREGALSLTGFHNREGARIDTARARPVETVETGWGSTALSLRYRGRLGGAESALGVAWSAFEARAPVVSRRGIPGGGGTDRLRATADFAREVGPVGVGYGASFDHLSLRSEGRPPAATRVAEGSAGGAYLEGSWQPAPRLRLRGGMRGDLFSVDPAPRFSPRASATWLVGERAALSLAAGRYHQLVRTWARPATWRPPLRDNVPFVPAGLEVGRASHLTLALHQEMEAGVWLGVEGFYKGFEGISAPQADRAHASGVDLWVRRDAGRFRGSLGYSLSWVWSEAAEPGASDLFEGRQVLNAAVAGSLGRWGEADLRLAYGAGLPFTPIPLGELASGADAAPQSAALTSTRGAAESSPIPTSPADDYFRVDFGITRTFTPRWQGLPMRISPYLRVLNGLNRRDALFYLHRRGEDGGPRPLAALPLLPVLGVSWQF